MTKFEKAITLCPKCKRNLNTEIDYCWHHVTNDLVVAVPLSMHQHYCFPQNVTKHRELVNERIETLYGVNLKELII